MASTSKSPALIALSMRSLKPHPEPFAGYFRPLQAIFVARSENRDYNFTFSSGGLNDEKVERCRELQRHGFTVVEFSDEHGLRHFHPLEWQNQTIIGALSHVEAIYKDADKDEDMTAYDREFADTVLEVLEQAFPSQQTMMQLKYQIDPEPSDEKLLTAIDALLIDRYVEGPAMRSGQNQLDAVAFVRMTAEGRQYLKSKSTPQTPAGHSVIYGDQNNNYANAGAIGRNSVGNVQVNQRWAGIENEVDLHDLAQELEELRTEFRKTHHSREDDKQLAIIGDAADAAERGDGQSTAGHLSRTTKNVLAVAQSLGMDLAARVIVELSKPG